MDGLLSGRSFSRRSPKAILWRGDEKRFNQLSYSGPCSTSGLFAPFGNSLKDQITIGVRLRRYSRIQFEAVLQEPLLNFEKELRIEGRRGRSKFNKRANARVRITPSAVASNVAHGDCKRELSFSFVFDKPLNEGYTGSPWKKRVFAVHV